MRIQAAPGLRGCCDEAGRMIALCYQPLPLERVIALAQARGEGTRAELEARVRDMVACGMLIEIEEP